MLGKGKVSLKKGSDSSYVFPIIIEEISLLRNSIKNIMPNINSGIQQVQIEAI